ncbi:hypothetical protein D9756_007975 [Leucocoprinus leucothites]|uniref:Allergen n=1 Tax=Leucocoprinus leucothites TaxID=201217 RepID=A0A8H5D5D2_9AGAR|nr:hypothetical protein D9756_007975 [Leucoagaricus leucothites]
MARITSAFKNLTSPSGPTESEAKDTATEGVDYAKEHYGDTSSAPRRNTTTRSQKLPPGTGPGTSGKRASESAMEYDRDHARERGTIAGYGTDSAAAHGGGLADTHRESLQPPGERLAGTERLSTDRDRERYETERPTGSGPGVHITDRGTTLVSSVPGQAAPVVSGRGTGITVDRNKLVRRGSDHSSVSRRSHVLDQIHQHGHSGRDTMPSGPTQEDTNQLNPITHERIRHLETEEVARVKEIDRHVHHIQHHIQPVFASETLTEQIKDFMHPVTNIREIHANKVEDNSLFHSQIGQHHDTLTHLERERTIIDKGVTVKERTHHHVHHIIQPIIEKETVDRQRIRTTIPIHEISHDAPVIHQSQTHNAVPIEHFLKNGGILHNAVPSEDIGSRVLHTGQCTREIDGIADDITRELNLTETYREPVNTTHQAIGYRDENAPLERDVNLKQKSLRAPDTQVDEPLRVPMA